jgi:integrase
MAKNLTALKIVNIKPGDARQEIADGKCRGLYLIVQPSGRKSWGVRYRFGGRTRKLTLPGFVSLGEARKLASEALHDLELGKDPIVERKQACLQAEMAKADTVYSVTEEYLRREGKKLRSVDRRRRIFERNIYPTLGSRPVGEVKRIEIIRLLDDIEENSGPRMADYVLACLQRVMNWHAIRSEEFRSPIPRGLEKRRNPDEAARERTLSDSELRAVWKVADGFEGPFGSFVQFLLLTAARRTEAARMTWSEIDGSDWTLPRARNKTKKDLVRPLSGKAQAILAKMPRFEECPYVFTNDGQRPLPEFHRPKKELDAKAGVTDWQLHDLRRTARSLMSRAGVMSDHAEHCLGHVLGGVRKTYDRYEYHKEKQLAFEALATQIDLILDPQSNVTQIRGRK